MPLRYLERYRHVVFSDTPNVSRRAVNLSPAKTDSRNDPFRRVSLANWPSELREEPLELQLDEGAFLRWLFERTSVSMSAYRPETLARRLPACLRILRAGSVAHARAMIERNHALAHQAVSALVIGVTSFFRDDAVFAHLRDHVLPRIGSRSGVRIWSVGCSDGAELYSIAILLAQARVLHRCQLLGTDCRVEATRAAAIGRYPAMALRSVDDSIRANYFTRDADGWYTVRPTLRACTQWRTADVLQVQEPGPWDIILCRNMAMYFRPEAAGRVWRGLEQSLRAGGYLVLGKAERPHAAAGATRFASVAPCIYRRERNTADELVLR